MKRIISIFILLIILIFSVVPSFALDTEKYSYTGPHGDYYLFENYGSNPEEFVSSLIEAETFDIDFVGNEIFSFTGVNETFSQGSPLYYMIFDSSKYPDGMNGENLEHIVLLSSSLPLIYNSDDDSITYNTNYDVWQEYYYFTYYVDDLGLHLWKYWEKRYLGFDGPRSMDIDTVYISSFDICDSSGTVYFPKGEYFDKYEESFNSGSEDSGSEDSVTNFSITKILKDFVSWLFVPDDGFLDTWKDEQIDKIDNLNNIITYPFSLLVRFGDSVLNLKDETDPRFCYKDLSFTDDTGKKHILLSEGCYHFNSVLEIDWINSFYDYYILFVKFILVGFFIRLCYSKFNSIFNKG